MPDARDDAATSHDRHDPMLVAALAAGDLAGAERDQAIALIGSCTECGTLHADLVAIARATATVPPPFPPRARLPADAPSRRRASGGPAGGASCRRARPGRR